jgi:predicted ATPase
MAKANGKKPKPEKTPQGITHITVGGYKSIAREQTIEIRPLTILAGANSSGKSSIMQPLLLLKQTLEAPYDPGALLLNGPNVKFTSVEQMLTRIGKVGHHSKLTTAVRFAENEVQLFFDRSAKKQLDLQRQKANIAGRKSELKVGDLTANIVARGGLDDYYRMAPDGISYSVVRDRCFLEVSMSVEMRTNLPAGIGEGPFTVLKPAEHFGPSVQAVIHLPGLRGNPARAYPVAAFGASFPGTFEVYTASVLLHWSGDRVDEKLDQIGADLKNLGLSSKVKAGFVNDVQVELKVGRVPKVGRGGAHDLVNIADVGFGVSQTLPVVVALLAAEPGQLVYLEQPEIHLHPRAQIAMAQVLANAAIRGVKVVAETHSSLLLLGIQSLVAEGKLPRDKVILHWFERNEEGATDIRSAELDEAGRFGDWPEDFDDVTLEVQSRYLDAAEARRAAR